MRNRQQAFQNAQQLLQENSDAPARDDKRQQATELIHAAEADLQLVNKATACTTSTTQSNCWTPSHPAANKPSNCSAAANE
jgi:hypothetical protein